MTNSSRTAVCLLVISMGVFLAISSSLMAQKKVSELTLVYEFVISNGNAAAAPSPGGPPEGATNTVYIKGFKSRSEITSSLFSSTTLLDAKTNTAVILKEVSGQKLLIRLTPENWHEKNMRFEGITFKNTNETKEIAGYKCQQAVARRNDGYMLTVFYTRELIPEDREYDPQFRSLDGLPLEYEITNGSLKIKYTVTKLNLNPVPASKFDIPKGGYREMTYEESKKANVSGM